MIHHIAEEDAAVAQCGADISDGKGRGSVRESLVDCSDCLYQIRQELLREIRDHVGNMHSSGKDWEGTLHWKLGRILTLQGEVALLTKRMTESLIKEGKP